MATMTTETTKEKQMTAPQTIKIDNIEYVRADAQPLSGDMKIVVLDRGFVFVGRVAFTDDSVVIANAKNIRKWGTTKGLGELVNGPLSGTVLDAAGTVIAPKRAMIFTLTVDEQKWTTI